MASLSRINHRTSIVSKVDQSVATIKWVNAESARQLVLGTLDRGWQ